MNLCRACEADFASLAAFDRHRVGKHGYLASPERPDGRRCLETKEIMEAGFELDEAARWRLALTEARAASLAALREASQEQNTSRRTRREPA